MGLSLFVNRPYFVNHTFVQCMINQMQCFRLHDKSNVCLNFSKTTSIMIFSPVILRLISHLMFLVV